MESDYYGLRKYGDERVFDNFSHRAIFPAPLHCGISP